MLRYSTTIPKHSKQNSPTYVFESGIVKKKIKYSVGDNRQVWRNTIFWKY